MLDNTTIATEVARKRAVEEATEATTAADCETKRPRRGKNVKYAMMLAYQGQNYFGMQYQRQEQEYPTIESHVLRAMLKHQFLEEKHLEDLYPWHFQRAARTDRSVSAVRQICSMFLPLDQNFIDNGPALLNATLPDDIRVFSIRRVTPSFHAQKTCDSRTYSYTLPTFAFAPCDQLTTDAYRISDERIAEVEELLQCFVGTHNFYNYTARISYADPRSKRNIIAVRCERPFLYRDQFHQQREVEFIGIHIHGQSFMMHQIRKMIGVVLAILRGFLYKSDIARSFQSDRMDIPRAPGLGLLLERLHYNRYEKKYGVSHGSLNDWGEQLERDVLEWRDRMIMQRILAEECRTQNMMKWLSTLPMHQFNADPEEDDIVGERHSPLALAAQTAYRAINPEDPVSALREVGGEEAVEEMMLEKRRTTATTNDDETNDERMLGEAADEEEDGEIAPMGRSTATTAASEDDGEARQGKEEEEEGNEDQKRKAAASM